ncbi:MAG: hypothetical protein U1E27_06360, partial [Kiritimatiellia bacterium]|nr:hypothetical protein [Kiritimatiellia bacterium]
MKPDLIAQLSGTGYVKLLESRRKLSLSLLAGSGLAFVLILSAISTVVILRNLRETRRTFLTAPKLKTYKPKDMEHRVKVQRRQKSSSRPQITPRMVSTRLSSFALPEIMVDPKLVKTSFQAEFKPVSGMGMGAGLGGGLGLGGFGSGVSEFDFIGIRGRGERIAILVDVSESMVEPQVGGVAGFNRVKGRINEVIDSLNPGTLFNVIAFADAASSWQKELVPATDVNKRQAKMWLQPFNASEKNAGLTSGNIQPSKIGLPSDGGTTRLELGLTAAFDNRADTILVSGD